MARKPIEWHALASYENDDSALYQYFIALCGHRSKKRPKVEVKKNDTACTACQTKLLEIANAQAEQIKFLRKRLDKIVSLATSPDDWQDQING